VKFIDGTDVNATAVVKSLTRTKTDPESKLAGLLKSFDSFEAKDPMTVVARLNVADVNVLYTLVANPGMIVSAKALDDKVNLNERPTGSGPYKLVSSGPQGAVYERNEGYFNKAQNQFAKVNMGVIVDTTARLNAILTGQADIGLFQVDQSYPKIQEMVKSGKFQAPMFLQPNNYPLYLNTKIKPLDNPKVRQALNLALDRDLINEGLQYGECKPSAQPFAPGIVGYDEKLVPKKDIAKAKQLLQEAGVGPFTIDTLVNVGEPYASMGVTLKDQLAAIGVNLNIIPANSTAIRPQFRAGNHGAMLHALSAPSPDPASLIDGVFLTPDNPGGGSPEFEKAVADAKTKPLGSPEREVAYQAVSKLAYEDPRQIYICWAKAIILARKEITGLDQTAYINALLIPDFRSYSITKGN
jgi:peptide/nickel transport system substrate-binding protein